MTNAKIHVTFSHAGLHRWKDAPEHRSYLRSPHRHLFTVTVGTTVEHDDREIEYHDLIDEASSSFAYAMNGHAAINRSCEHMARELAERLSARYGGRWFLVSVWEDGECGSTVEVETKKKAPANRGLWSMVSDYFRQPAS